MKVWKSDESGNTLNTICCEPVNICTGYLSSCSREHYHYNNLLLALVDWLLDFACTQFARIPTQSDLSVSLFYQPFQANAFVLYCSQLIASVYLVTLITLFQLR